MSGWWPAGVSSQKKGQEGAAHMGQLTWGEAPRVGRPFPAIPWDVKGVLLPAKQRPSLSHCPTPTQHWQERRWVASKDLQWRDLQSDLWCLFCQPALPGFSLYQISSVWWDRLDTGGC